MRFVPTNCLREGMILADNLYNNYGELLLSGGLVLNEDYLKSIRRLKYNGIYIDDDISKDIPVLNMISETIKAKTVKGIRVIDKLSFSNLLTDSKVRFIVHIFCYAIKYRIVLNLYRKIPVKTIA